MPQAINELDVDYEAQIQEIKRLVSTTSDPDRRASLEDQLRELELASVQAEQLSASASFSNDTTNQRRKSFRPTSAKPRTMLSALSEDQEVHLTSTSFQNLDAYRQENAPSLIAEVMSSSFDEQYPASSVTANDQCTFWMSSGMFPQFLRLVLREPMPIAAVEVTCRHVKKLKIRSSRGCRTSISLGAGDPKAPLTPTATEFQVPATDGGKQSTHRIALAGMGDAEVVEIVIESGYSDFVCVYFVRLRLADPPTAASDGGDGDDADSDDGDDEVKT